MVGLDPRPDHFPEPFRARAAAGGREAAQATVDYHRALIDVVAPKVGIVKPQSAFFEQLGPDGFAALRSRMIRLALTTPLEQRSWPKADTPSHVGSKT